MIPFPFFSTIVFVLLLKNQLFPLGFCSFYSEKKDALESFEFFWPIRSMGRALLFRVPFFARVSRPKAGADQWARGQLAEQRLGVGGWGDVGGGQGWVGGGAVTLPSRPGKVPWLKGAQREPPSTKPQTRTTECSGEGLHVRVYVWDV